MPEHIFNSRDRAYKSIYGAIKSGETVTFRLLLPFEYGPAPVNSATLIVYDSEMQKFKRIPLKKTDETYSGSAFWSADYTPVETGLYWYRFEFTAGSDVHSLCKGMYGTGYVDSCSDMWQLTVYSGSQVVPGKWKGGIMYQIFPDRFKNSGTKHEMHRESRLVPWDSTPEFVADKDTGLWNVDYFGGDLKGIESELPYLASLGVDIIYLNPIFEAHSNHRYNTANYKRIDPILGNEDDFVSLCVSAHKLGMKIILDGVFSHTGDDSIYFNKYGHYPTVGAYQSKDSKYYSWYKFGKWPDEYHSWWGIPLLPEVEEMTPSYVRFITGEGGIIEHWLRLGADGWRLDVADELPDEFIRAIRHRIKTVKPDALLLGEVWEDASNKTAYGIRRRYLLGSELDSVMNYPFRQAILDFVAYDKAEYFFEQILTVTENYPKQIVDSLMNPLGTHDTARILSLLAGYNFDSMNPYEQSQVKLSDEERKKASELLRIAAVLQYTLPGFPSLYYGDETGLEGGKDPFNRGSFKWNESEQDTGLLSFFRELGNVRRHKSYILADADFVPVSAADGVVCYERRKTGRDEGSYSLVVIANRGDDCINYTLPYFIKDTEIVMASEGVNVNADLIHLPARSYVILENVPVIKKPVRPGSKI